MRLVTIRVHYFFSNYFISTCLYEVVHEFVAGECQESYFEGRILFESIAESAGYWFILLVLLEYHNSKGVVRATSRGLDMALHWSGLGASPLMSPRQDETNEPLL